MKKAGFHRVPRLAPVLFATIHRGQLWYDKARAAEKGKGHTRLLSG
jgi:hypothetical protein